MGNNSTERQNESVTKSERVVSIVNKAVKQYNIKNLQKSDLSSADLFEND